MTDLRDNRRGILAMAIAMAAFNLADALTKLATQQLPLGETIFMRGLFASLAVAAAKRAFPAWAALAGDKRKAVLHRIADLIEAEAAGKADDVVPGAKAKVAELTAAFPVYAH